MHNPNANLPRTTFRFIWDATRPYSRWFYGAIFFLFLADLLGGLQSYAFQKFVDAATSYGETNGSISDVFFWVAAYPLFLLLAAGSIRGVGYMLNYLTVHSRTQAVKSLFEYLSLHSIGFFNERFAGALSNRVTQVAGNVARLQNNFIWSMLSPLFTFFVTATLIATASTALAVGFTVGFLLLIPINIALTRQQKDLSEKMAATAAHLRGQVIDVVTNITAVQQFALRGHELQRLDTSIAEHRDADVASDNFRERVLLFNNILISLFIGGVILWAFFLWQREAMSLGSLVMIVALTRGFMRDLSHIGQNMNFIMEAYGEMRDGLKDIARPHAITDEPNAVPLAVSRGAVAFERVTFGYENDPRNVFKNLELHTDGGEKIGIVGPSGAGKTTFVKLLLREHDVRSGTITIDGQDIREVTQESLRENIAIVPQEPLLFHRSIRENILYGKLDASEEEMIAVAKKAQAHDFITAIPEGYDALVGERGVKLSVGQRQRIAIARALLKNAPILILDEATSALDSESEVAIQKALHALMEGKTVFAIAHRLSTLREMDRIIVLKNGSIVQDGTHTALIASKGIYASLWSHQASGFLAA